MIESILLEPGYLVRIRSLARRLGIHPTLAPWLCATLIVFVYEATQWLRGQRHDDTDVAMLWGGSVAFALGLNFLANCYGACRAAMAAFESIVVADDERHLLHMRTERIFNRRRLERLGRWAALTFWLYYLWMWPSLTFWPFHVLMAGVAGWLALISADGAVLALSTMHWISQLPRYRELRTFIVPCRTSALRTISALTGTFALYFSTQMAFETAVVYSTQWSRPWAFSAFSATVVAPLILLAVVFFFFPQFAIRKLIQQRKQVELSHLADTLPPMALHDAQTRAAISSLYRDVEDSSDFALDTVTVARFISSAALAFLSTGIDQFVTFWIRRLG